MEKNKGRINTYLSVMYISLKRLIYGDYSYQASALAFITLLSLVPIVSIVLYLFSFFSAFNSYILMAENYVYRNFLPDSTLSIRSYINQFIHQTHQLPTVSILFSIFTGVMLILTIEHSMNTIWRVKHKKRNILTTLISWFSLLLMPLFLGLLVFINVTLSSVLDLKYQFIIFHILTLFINSFLFGFTYTVFTRTTISWQDALIGGFIAAVLFDLAKWLFVFYIKYLTSYEYVYGTLGIIPIFLLWLYVAWVIILYGALFIYTKNEK